MTVTVVELEVVLVAVPVVVVVVVAVAEVVVVLSTAAGSVGSVVSMLRTATPVFKACTCWHQHW